MTRIAQPPTLRFSATLLLMSLVVSPGATLAHSGHGNEFGGSQSAQSAGSIRVDPETAQRLGLKVEPVSRQRLAYGIKTTGQLEALPNQKVEVTTPVKGTVVKLLVNPGDTVRRGQPVAIMTSPELAELRTAALDRQAEAIAAGQQAQADLRLAQQNLEQQKRIVAANIRQARTQVNVAQERYDKDRELLASGAIPRRTVLESETKLAEARAVLAKAASALEVSEAQAQLRRAQSAVEVAQSRRFLSGKTYQTRLQQLGAQPNSDGTITIAAPIAGIVVDRETTQGESGEDAGKKVMTIVDGNTVQVSANIYEKDLNQIQKGQRVQVKANGIPNRFFEGRIRVIGAMVEGETRVVPVKAELDNSGGVLKPGMFVELEVLTTRTPANLLTIPKTALVETNTQQKLVFVQNGDAFEPTQVTLGRESGTFVEIKNGLFDGDRIVTQAAPMLYAQSLRGGSPTTNDHGAAAKPANHASGQVPWWVMVPVGGAIAAGTFWAGMMWAKRGNQQKHFSP
ncbi:efflux RND transporter periplasmic adaptor subunit (plasmid) [Kovacikia minuta CCNUW1]|uniref:efflux RND transporter periplasmic adaptor subunit n=1 Tax=Kovacikia minuta TaxID=2931930 RepID=UPI001CCD6FBC|nr:efflux RND transporter periplasmic adaptor subunit [Kovacikia minuta]UBF30287.1 efflux RND transporter periplasmic adaptor subunit [Kovacikia minuta CCNUW1]